MISMCDRCKLAVWPPNEICSRCFGSQVSWKKSSEIGRLLEFSQKKEEGGEQYFCIAEFDEGVRIMGRLSTGTAPEIGQKVRLENAGMRNGDYVFEMAAVW